MPWVSKKHYDILVRSEAFFQQQYLLERTRSDRLTDRLLEANAQLPVSDEALTKHAERKQEQFDMREELKELLIDEIPLEVVVESTPTEDIN